MNETENNSTITKEKLGTKIKKGLIEILKSGKLPIYLGVIIMVLFPIVCQIILLNPNSSYPTQNLVMVFSLIIMMGLFFMILAYAAQHPDMKIKFKRVKLHKYLPIVFLILFLVWATLSVFFAKNLKLALYDYPSRREGLFMYFAYAGIFAGCFCVRNEKFTKFVIGLFLSVMLLFCVYSILDVLWLKTNENTVVFIFTAPWRNQNHTGYILVLATILAGACFAVLKNKALKILSLITFTLCNFAVCLNDSFGSQLAIFVGLIIATIFLLIRNIHYWKWLIIMWICFAIATVGGILFQIYYLKLNRTYWTNCKEFIHDIVAIFSNDSTKDQIAGSGDSSSNSAAGTGRWGLWVECFKNMREYPWFGIGINCQLLENPFLCASRPHNEFLQFGSTMGIPSLIFYLGFVISTFVMTIINIKKMNTPAFLCMLCIFGYWISSLFGISAPYTFSYYIMFAGLAVSGLYMKSNVPNKKTKTIESNATSQTANISNQIENTQQDTITTLNENNVSNETTNQEKFCDTK